MSLEGTPNRWVDFFDRHAPRYMENGFTQWTTTEVSFLEKHMPLKPGMSILDIGCGTGRHALELARRGYRVTGLDLSEGMLAEGQKVAAAEGLQIEWIHGDATTFSRPSAFDAAICLCEGGLGLVDLDAEPVRHDLEILRNAYAAIRPGGPFLLTALNGYAIIRRMTDDHVKQGSFDPATMVAQYLDELDLPEGKVQMAIKERLFIPPEFVAMMRHVGFKVRHVWGGTAGEWGERPVKLDEIEMMVVAQRPG